MRIDSAVVSEGRVDLQKLRPVGRVAYSQEYTVTTEVVHDDPRVEGGAVGAVAAPAPRAAQL